MFVSLGKEFVDGFSKMDKLAYHAAADVGQFGTAEEQHRLNTRQMTVDVSHISLVLKVGDVSDTTQDKQSADAAGKVGCQSVVGSDADAWLVGVQFANGSKTLVKFREGML